MTRFLHIAALLGLVATGLAGCQSGPPPNGQAPAVHRLLVAKSHVKEAVEHERAFARYYDVKAPAGENWFAIDLGATPVLVVAGHATTHTREGSRKAADRGTGSLAVMLHKLTGVTAIYTVYESPSDPNDDDGNAFKESVSNLLQELQPALVLDLHASHADRPYAVDFGTMEGRSLLERGDLLPRLEDALRREGVQDLSHDYFSAQRHQTITKWVSGHGVPCIQLEINSTWLTHAGDHPAEHHRFEQLLQGLVNFLQGFEPADTGKESALHPLPPLLIAR
ncbi:MAG: ketol-acid reductoisomerase [Nitrospiraceae bacterium]